MLRPYGRSEHSASGAKSGDGGWGGVGAWCDLRTASGEEGNWVEPTLQPAASQVEAPQHRHPLSPLPTLNDGLLSLLQTLCQRTQVISISMHVPGPGTNLDCKIYSRHKTWGGVGG